MSGDRLAPGTRVRLVDAGMMPSIRSYVGRQGVTERPESDGTYVRFADNSYVFCYWPEVTRLDSEATE